MKKITVDATVENLGVVQDFIEQEIMSAGVMGKSLIQTSIAVEEIYVNIAHYAYNSEVGEATICCNIEQEPTRVVIEFCDSGKPYNPLEKEDADITLGVEEREIGGLGILMVKKSMDGIAYKYKDGKNILTIEKYL